LSVDVGYLHYVKNLNRAAENLRLGFGWDIAGLTKVRKNAGLCYVIGVKKIPKCVWRHTLFCSAETKRKTVKEKITRGSISFAGQTLLKLQSLLPNCSWLTAVKVQTKVFSNVMINYFRISLPKKMNFCQREGHRREGHRSSSSV